MPLKITQRAAAEVIVLDLNGRLWILDLPLRDLIAGLLTEGTRNFVLNIAEVDYMDSSGLGQLVSIWTSIKNKGGHMIILSPNQRVQRLFEITRLHTVFTILHSEEEALEKARKTSA
jgi:anti-sigma B factor antagonist